MAFKEIAPEDLMLNPFTKIGKEWMLITAGADAEHCNTMTASWGAMGVMWGKNVIETVIRHSRYTLEFVEKSEFFTVSFYPESQREALKFCGTHSGRDCDKADESGLTPYFVDGTTAFEQAEMIFVCRRIFSQDMALENLSEDNYRWYPDKDIHKAFIGEIVKVLVKE